MFLAQVVSSKIRLLQLFVKAKIKKPLDKRRIVHLVEILTDQNRIRKGCSMRKDSWSAGFLGRLSSFNDLVDEEAVHYKHTLL